ncbi:putative ABC transport system permease protein [Catalinimonas alkaloidigena]|uniref:Putative ABC transport system permease protein n=1 Tax=Catalinimonas alkaloidigena TaxID=1075417 RepID=A0A1G9UWD8_9BACT|nr:ABC transporter permease [Catalinimonas alkaloidigena]SDM64130.1 putative ABC transport system permease protein [Catalinimonas alkaloidigena]
MLRNYLLIAWRNLLSNKVFSLINILGLAFGIAACLLIAFFVWDELAYDAYHPEGERVFRVYNESTEEESGTVKFHVTVPPMFAPTLDEFAEVESTCRVLMALNYLPLFSQGKRQIYEPNGLFVDSTFLELLALPLRYGDAATALTEPNTLVLSRPLAEKYFGPANPVGNTLLLDGVTMRVTGVLTDLPARMHLAPSFLLPMATFVTYVEPERMESWRWQQFFTYIKLRKGVEAQAVEARLQSVVKAQAWPQTQSSGSHYLPFLQPLRQIHLHSSQFVWEIAERGNIAHVRALTLVGLFLLLIAGINFVNLSTARATRRAREVGVRKTNGALRSQLILQFTSEALLVAGLAFSVAMAMVQGTLPWLRNFTEKNLGAELLRQPLFWVLLLGSVLVLGVLAGFYPAWVLSAYQPIRVLKGKLESSGRQSVFLRQGLVVTQFALSALLILSTLIIQRQVDYLQHSDLGFQKEQLLVLPLRGALGAQLESVKEELLRRPHILAATAGYGLPGDALATDAVKLPGREGELTAAVFTVDHDYVKTLGLEVAAGRDLSREYPSDEHSAFLLNETAVKSFGFGTPKEALGQRLDWDMWGKDSLKQGTVVGVVRDFHFKSLREKVAPAVLHIYPEAYATLSLRLEAKGLSQTLAFLEEKWHEWVPDQPFTYKFLDENFEAMYRSERRVGTLFRGFTALALFVALLGLVGLVIFTTEQRIREIGIRKVFGASVLQVVTTLARDFVGVIVLGVGLGLPIAYFATQNWLGEFAYRIQPGWELFVGTGILILSVALLTMVYQFRKAALANPVDTLRYE